MASLQDRFVNNEEGSLLFEVERFEQPMRENPNIRITKTLKFTLKLSEI